MKITAQEEYGLRCILSLAREEARDPVSAFRASLTIGQIAEREGLSTEYAGKLMGVLGRAGLVESVRGRHGGFRLARPAKETCVAAVLTALGGKLYRSVETCDRFSGDLRFCVHSNTCSIRSLWSGLQLLLDYVLSRTTLHNLVATSEVNLAEWMRSQFQAMSQIGGPESMPALAAAGAGTVTLVTPDSRAKTPATSPGRAC